MSIECSCDLMLINQITQDKILLLRNENLAFMDHQGPPNVILYSVIIGCLPEGPPK